MSFSSILVLCLFLPACLALYWLAPRTRAAQNAVLLLVSYVYYASWGPKAVGLFALTMVFAGRAQDRFGPRIVATFGGLFTGAGLLVASLATNWAPDRPVSELTARWA